MFREIFNQIYSSEFESRKMRYAAFNKMIELQPEVVQLTIVYTCKCRPITTSNVANREPKKEKCSIIYGAQYNINPLY